MLNPYAARKLAEERISGAAHMAGAQFRALSREQRSPAWSVGAWIAGARHLSRARPQGPIAGTQARPAGEAR